MIKFSIFALIALLYTPTLYGNMPIRAERTTQTYTTDQEVSYENGYIPVLVYHKFATEVAEVDKAFIVQTDLFEQQLLTLIDNGYTPVTMLDLAKYLHGLGGMPDKPFLITMDDGYLCNYEEAFPVLTKYDIPATYFVIADLIGDTTYSSYFDWEQAKEMEDSGLIDIQNHTSSHILMDSTDCTTAQKEVLHCLREIETHLGKRDVHALAYPQCLYTDDTIVWLEQIGVDLQFTGIGNDATCPTNIQRIAVSSYDSPEKLLRIVNKLCD
ncbi:MAG: hypothetical protein ATN35_04780 [Epulopiscium sp. Nele67-Bin004]|nr:MAG: hypothetical protein ATN35_04780 [Epulopiscium sp. Nele67-Bin004]